MNVRESVKLTRNLLFEYKIEQFIQNVVSLIEYASQTLSDNKLFLEIIECMEIGFNNEDYLFVGDLLQFELQPLMESMGEHANDFIH